MTTTSQLTAQVRHLQQELRLAQSKPELLPIGVSVSQLGACLAHFSNVEEQLTANMLPARSHRKAPAISRFIADSWPFNWRLTQDVSTFLDAYYQAPERTA